MSNISPVICGKLLTTCGYLNAGFAVDYGDCFDAHVPVRAAMICVDFADKRAAELDTADETNTTVYYKRILADDGLDVFDKISFGRLDLTIDFYDKWYHMPLDAKDYHMARVMSAHDHRNYIAAAMLACSADVDLSKYDIFYIAAIKAADEVPYSPTLVDRSHPVKNEAGEVGLAVTFGGDMHYRRGKLLAHETGHIFGLPDLYTYDTVEGSSGVFGLCGSWDLMGLIDGVAPDYCAWHKWRLGFIDDSQVTVGSGETTLSPVETAGGVKLAVVPIDENTGYAAEVRAPLGLDEKLDGSGVLIYYIDGSIHSGHGCMAFMPRDPAKRLKLEVRTRDELFIPGDVFTDAERGIKIEVVSEADGNYTIITSKI